MTPGELTALLALLTAMTFTPGPNTTLSASLGANGGLRHALRFVCAVPVGWGLLLGACVLGLGVLITTVPALRWGIKLVGMGYLVWLAWQLARRSRFVAGGSQALHVGFGQGVALQFVNIKGWLAAMLISTGWVVGQADPWQRLVWVLPLTMLFGLASNFTYALVGVALRRWLSQGERLLVFNRVMAGILMATAAWMVTV